MTTTVKDRMLRFRVSDDDDMRLRTAAKAVGETLTDFTIRPALERADAVLARADVTLISVEQFKAMTAVLAEPVLPIPELVAAASRPRMFTRA